MPIDERCDLLCLDLPQAEAIRRTRLAPTAAFAAAERARALGDPTRLTLAAALDQADGRALRLADAAGIDQHLARGDV